MSGSMTVFIAIHYTGDEMKGLRWVGHIARMGREEEYVGVLEGKITGRDNFEHPDVGGGLV